MAETPVMHLRPVGSVIPLITFSLANLSPFLASGVIDVIYCKVLFFFQGSSFENKKDHLIYSATKNVEKHTFLVNSHSHPQSGESLGWRRGAQAP